MNLALSTKHSEKLLSTVTGKQEAGDNPQNRVALISMVGEKDRIPPRPNDARAAPERYERPARFPADVWQTNAGRYDSSPSSKFVPDDKTTATISCRGAADFVLQKGDE